MHFGFNVTIISNDCGLMCKSIIVLVNRHICYHVHDN